MNSRDRFLAALKCEPLERPPLWVMRQAGRFLPEYRALKAQSSFLEMVKTPNLDPVLLQTSPDIVRREATRLLESMRGKPGHIFNLGHGITPDAKIECMQTLVETVTDFR